MNEGKNQQIGISLSYFATINATHQFKRKCKRKGNTRDTCRNTLHEQEGLQMTALFF